jgi:hypothetical protein
VPTCLLAAAVGACAPICGIGSHLTLSNARVDSSYTCPKQVTNHPYDVNATIDVDNFTNNAVTIRSIAETDTAVAVHGDWNGELGAKGGGSVADYSPRSISAGSKATIRFKIAFQCTDQGTISSSTYADFRFAFTVTTSAGTYKLGGANKHRLITP